MWYSSKHYLIVIRPERITNCFWSFSKAPNKNCKAFSKCNHPQRPFSFKYIPMQLVSEGEAFFKVCRFLQSTLKHDKKSPFTFSFSLNNFSRIIQGLLIFLLQIDIRKKKKRFIERSSYINYLVQVGSPSMTLSIESIKN